MRRFLLVLLCFGLPAYGADFYVDNSGSPSCSDVPGNGSEANPWCTISYAASQIAGGDVVEVKAGTYANPGVIIDGLVGTASFPTTFRAYPGHSPVIQGAGYGTGRVKIRDAQYAVFSGFEVTSIQDGLFVESSTNVTVRDNHFHHTGQVCIAIKYDSSDILVENNICHDTGLNAGKWGEGIYVGTGSGGPLDNTNNVTVRDNTIHDVNDEAIELKPGTHDCIVEGNTIYNATTDSGWPATAGAIEVNHSNSGEQSWGSNPDHIIRNNIIHSSKTAIRAGTGGTFYNNLIYNTVSPYRGIYVDNTNSDSYIRVIYHNTIDIPSDRAVVINAGATDVKNNIGPTTTDNIATSDAYYFDKAGADYHLVSGSAPIDAGLDLTAIVPTDIEGASRLTNPPPDLGAYEHVADPRPDPPTNLRVIVQ
jgi:parallel beta-helix repeat protein